MPEELPKQTTALAIAYNKDYEMNDITLSEPFVVLKPVSEMGRPAWWNGEAGKGKVQMVFNGLKMDLPVKGICIYAGITIDQWRNFNEIHTNFSLIKPRLRETMKVLALQGLYKDIQDPGNFRTRQWYLEKAYPEKFGRNIGAQAIPPTAIKKITAEAFLDETGKVLTSKQTSETWENDYGNSGASQGEN